MAIQTSDNERKFKSDLEDVITRSLNIISRNTTASHEPINGIIPAAYLPGFDDATKQDTFLTDNGSKAVADLCKKLSEIEHPDKITLGRLHGQSFIKAVIDEIVPQVTPDVHWAVDTLAALSKDDWTVFIAIENIVVSQVVDLGICKLHPPKLPQVTILPPEYISDHDWILKHPFIELEVSASNHQAAYLKAKEIAWTILAFIHTPHISMVTAKGPETLPTFFCYHRQTNEWFPPDWKIPHRMIEFSLSRKEDLNYASHLKGRLLKWQKALSSNTELSEVLKQAAVLIQMAKTNSDEGTKLLLLVGAMDTMAMDEFRSGHTKEFNRRMQVLVPEFRKWKIRSDLKFLTKIYKIRSDIVHSGDRHFINHADLLTLEAVAVIFLNMLTDSGASTHADALKSLNIAAPLKKSPFSIKSWVRSILSGRKPDQLK